MPPFAVTPRKISVLSLRFQQILSFDIQRKNQRGGKYPFSLYAVKTETYLEEPQHIAISVSCYDSVPPQPIAFPPPQRVMLFKCSCFSSCCSLCWNTIPSLSFWKIHAHLLKLCPNVQAEKSSFCDSPIRPHNGMLSAARHRNPKLAGLSGRVLWFS